MTTHRSGRRAVIDLGSATINLLVADVVRRGKKVRLNRVRTDSVLIELGRCLAETGGVGAARSALGDGIARFLVGAHDASVVSVVGTAALRTAPDGPAVLAELEHQYRLTIHLLEDVREAQLGVLGCGDDIATLAPSLFVDLGGGSTQVVHLRDGAIGSVATLGVGASVLAAALTDPIGEDDWRALEERVAAVVATLPAAIGPGGALTVGGTARRLATLTDTRGRGHGDPVLERAAIEKILAALLKTDAAAFARRHDDDPARIRLLAPGGLLLGAILDRYGLASTRVSPQGLREGVLLAALADPDGWWLAP
ncbi:MAG: exopolyphosphatase / guanosine-5-triphosphate,3-diphosphate pyrophosphatase [Chloroflexota bacterium]|nr:exopolyphosphatase / guanosine-5-triphosphate,3-diphosphate pyrophosphatase [Chloroflexota bacterium]